MSAPPPGEAIYGWADDVPAPRLAAVRRRRPQASRLPGPHDTVPRLFEKPCPVPDKRLGPPLLPAVGRRAHQILVARHPFAVAEPGGVRRRLGHRVGTGP